jgi:hypothetical protein
MTRQRELSKVSLLECFDSLTVSRRLIAPRVALCMSPSPPLYSRVSQLLFCQNPIGDEIEQLVVA